MCKSDYHYRLSMVQTLDFASFHHMMIMFFRGVMTLSIILMRMKLLNIDVL